MKFLFAILFFSFRVFGQDIDHFYSYKYSAESDIMRSDYKSAVLNYNKAFQIKNLDRSSVRNYLFILHLKEELREKYFDTVLYYLAQYNENIELYSSVPFVKERILANKTKTFPFQNVDMNITCNEFYGKFGRMREEYQEIKNKGKALNLHEDSIANIEPFKSELRVLDSIQYYRFLLSLNESKYQSCFNCIFYSFYTGDFLRYGDDTTKYKLDKILLKLAANKKLDKSILISLLESAYNSSKTHVQKSEYEMTPEIVLVYPDKIIYEVLDEAQLKAINTKRKANNLEPYEIVIQKLKWQLESEYRRLFYITNTHHYYTEHENKVDKYIQSFTAKYPLKKLQMEKLKPKMVVYD